MTSLLYELLNFVNNGDLTHLDTFFENHADIINQYDLDGKMLKEHSCLLALTKLCSGCQQMTYSDIAKAIQVTPAEAEMMLVLAIQYGLIEGKIDQIKEEFTVT